MARHDAVPLVLQSTRRKPRHFCSPSGEARFDKWVTPITSSAPQIKLEPNAFYHAPCILGRVGNRRDTQAVPRLLFFHLARYPLYFIFPRQAWFYSEIFKNITGYRPITLEAVQPIRSKLRGAMSHNNRQGELMLLNIPVRCHSFKTMILPFNHIIQKKISCDCF